VGSSTHKGASINSCSRICRGSGRAGRGGGKGGKGDIDIIAKHSSTEVVRIALHCMLVLPLYYAKVGAACGAGHVPQKSMCTQLGGSQ